MPYSAEQFAQEIKTKHPEYKDWDNKYLVGEVLAKHPEYSTWVNKEEAAALHKTNRQQQAAALTKNFQPLPESQPKSIAEITGFSKNSYAPIPSPVDAVTGPAQPFVKGLVSAGRAIQATPDLLKGNLAEANKTMAKPVNLPLFGEIKPLQGSTTGENLITTLEAGSFLLPKVLKKAKGKLFPGQQEAVKDSLTVVKPQLSPAEEVAAKTAGRGKTTGFVAKKVEIAPSVQEIEMADVASESGVKSTHTFDKNIQLMKDFQRKSAIKVRAGLQDSKAIWNKNELKGVLNKVEEPISLSQPDLPIAKKLKGGILKLVDDANKKPEGILDVRQAFDDLVEKNFGKKAFAKDDPKGILIRNYRQALNKFAESKIPDGQLPGGSTLQAELRKQSLLYDAIESVAEKAPKAGESGRPFIGKTLNFIKKHPFVSAIAAYGARKVGKDAGLPIP